jgi:hypothetical protein
MVARFTKSGAAASIRYTVASFIHVFGSTCPKISNSGFGAFYILAKLWGQFAPWFAPHRAFSGALQVTPDHAPSCGAGESNDAQKPFFKGSRALQNIPE